MQRHPPPGPATAIESPRVGVGVRKPLRIVAFDLDNTLLDPCSVLYSQLHRTFFAEWKSTEPVDRLLEHFERTRQHGDALQRLGLANPIHDRGHPQSLAAFALTCPTAVLAGMQSESRRGDDHSYLSTIERLSATHTATTQGSALDRLRAEVQLRRLLLSDDARRLADGVRILAEGPEITERSERYGALAQRQSHRETGSLLARLRDRGDTAVVISQGQTAVQESKLRRAGCSEKTCATLLTTEEAAQPPGRRELESWVDARLAEPPEALDSDDELLANWTVRCAIDEWSRKTPLFYARCIHALAHDAGNARRALATLRVVQDHEWAQHDLRFLMVGDRIDTDVHPVLECLGRDGCETIHLRCGKYASLAGVSGSSSAAHRTFHTWDEVEEYLVNELDWTAVNRVRTPPRVVRESDFDAAALRRGLRSSMSVVRAVCELAVSARS